MHISGTRLVLATILYFLISSCGGEETSTPEPEQVPLGELMAAEDDAHREERCLNWQYSTGCYDKEARLRYCVVVKVRDAYRSDKLELTDLADWMDRTMRSDGAPQVYDLRYEPPGSPGVDIFEFYDWAKANGMDIGADQTVPCAEEVTQAAIAETEGGPTYFDADMLVEPDFLDFTPSNTASPDTDS